MLFVCLFGSFVRWLQIDEYAHNSNRCLCLSVNDLFVLTGRFFVLAQ